MKIIHKFWQKPVVVIEEGDVVACYFCKKPCVVGQACPWCGKPSPGPSNFIKKGL